MSAVRGSTCGVAHAFSPDYLIRRSSAFFLTPSWSTSSTRPSPGPTSAPTLSAAGHSAASSTRYVRPAQPSAFPTSSRQGISEPTPAKSPLSAPFLAAKSVFRAQTNSPATHASTATTALLETTLKRLFHARGHNFLSATK